jgi:peptidyl-prolyl cis-trans isomerase C
LKSRLTSYLQGALFTTIAAFALAAKAAPEAVATVNGKPVSKAVVDVLVQDQGLQGKPQESEFREYAKGQLIQREVMAQEAQALKLDKTAAYQKQLGEMQQAVQKQFEKAPKEQSDARIAFNTQGLQAQVFAEDFQKKHAPGDAAMRTEYKRITQSKGGTEYKLRHIQLDSEADAKGVISKLASGARFETLAAESTDLGSKNDGGDLGWIKVSSGADGKTEGLPAPFAEAVRKLAVGGFTREPVKTEEGYHVILLEGKRELPVGNYESYQAEIRESLQQQALDKEVQALIKKAKIS